MSKVVGLSQAIEETSPESIAARQEFVNYVKDCLELYAKGSIDVVCFGFVDAAGVPCVEFGEFPVVLANDVLALGLRARRDSEGICEEVHEEVRRAP